MFELKEIPIKDLVIQDRQRKDLGDLSELSVSLNRDGLLNPILVDENMRLIAGERRVRAAESLHWTNVLARIIPGLTKDQKLIIEMAENLGRKDFHWAEELQAKLSLFEYHKNLDESFSYRMFSKVLGVSLGGLSTDLELAKAVRELPELVEYKTKAKAREAYKRLQSQASAVIAMEALSDEDKERLQNMMTNHIQSNPEGADLSSPITPSEDDTPESSQSSVECTIPEGGETLIERHTSDMDGDLPKFVYEICKFNDLLSKIPDETIGFVEADPPYAINFDSVYGQAQDIDSRAQDWDISTFNQNMEILLYNLRKKLIQGSWVLLWIGAEHEENVQRIAHEAGYGIQLAGFWVKPGGSSNTPSTTMIHNYEKFLLLRYGNATFNTPSFKAVVECATVPHRQRYHQWQKPLELYNHFMKACGKPGSFFFSPFAGSGTSMISASLNGMTPIGCDITKKYFYQFYSTLKEYHYNGGD